MRLGWDEIRRRARAFSADWADAHYEKGETQSFYNDFFEILGEAERGHCRSSVRLARVADNRTKESRSRLMGRVKQRHTAPELTVRRLLHSLGYRFRLHRRDLPGSPDIVFPARKAAIFVHGCFWHAHGCSKGLPPKTRVEYWGRKLADNRARDRRNEARLAEAGWRSMTVWQCELKDMGELQKSLRRFLGPSRQSPVQGAICHSRSSGG
jgi:DNA mismatch endonuclease, patch repair protein